MTRRYNCRAVVRAALALTVIGGAWASQAASAADQGRIAMSVGRAGQSIFNIPPGAHRKLEVVDPGSGAAQFIAGTGDEPDMDDPTWGASGAKIAYLVEYQNEVNGKNTVVLKSVDDGTEQTVVSGLNGRIDGPSLSPAGDAIAYWLVAYDPYCGTCYTLYVKPLNGQGSTRTLAGPFPSGDLRLPGDPVAWSSDGLRIAFSYQRSIISLLAAGSGVKTLVPAPANGYASMPAYSPDGTRLLYLKQITNGAQSLIARTIDSGAETTALTVQGSEPLPFVGPQAWSPDGQQIAYTQLLGCPNNECDSTLNAVNADGTGNHVVLHRIEIYPGRAAWAVPLKPNYFVRQVEVAQAISPLLNPVTPPDPLPETPLGFPWSRPVAFGFPETLVAGKRTLVRVYVGDARLAPGAPPEPRKLDVRITSPRGDVSVSQQEAQVTAPQSPLVQTTKDGAVNLWLEAPQTDMGTVDLHVVVNPDKPEEECAGCHPDGNAADVLGVQFEHGGTLGLHPVPITIGGRPDTPPASTYPQALEGMRPLLPIADDHLIMGPEVPASIHVTELASLPPFMRCPRLWATVALAGTLASQAPLGGAERWAGYATLPDGVTVTCGGQAVSGSSSFVIVAPRVTIAAHELGHTLGLDHRVGLNDAQTPIPPLSLPYAGLGGVGYWQDGQNWGVYNGATTSDLMTYSDPAWTSPLTWSDMFTEILGGSRSAPARTARAATIARARRRLVSGVVRGEQAAIFESLVADGTPPAVDGPVAARVVARDVHGKTLSNTAVRGEPIAEGSDSTGSVPFLVALPPSARTGSLTVQSTAGKTLTRLRPSRHKPRGRLIGLPRKAPVAKPLTIQWRASDRDRKDHLTVIARARRGQSPWQTLALGIARGKTSVVPSSLGNKGKLSVQLLISDGFNTTTVRRPPIRLRP